MGFRASQIVTHHHPSKCPSPKPSQARLHVFSDASKEAYATVAYLVCRYPDRNTSSRIIASKSRVAPTKAVTIPRLELMGAVLSDRLAKTINKTLEIEGTIFWTDSTNVLHCIRNQSRELKPFVANRVGEIHRSSNPQQWRHIPDDMNPADLLTRALPATEMANSKVWPEGPSNIQCEESTWPPQLPNEQDEESIRNDERRKVAHVTIEAPGNNSIDPKHFSNFRNLAHAFGWVRRFQNNCKLPNEDQKKKHTLSVRELKDSETWWIKKAQTEDFPEAKTDSFFNTVQSKGRR